MFNLILFFSEYDYLILIYNSTNLIGFSLRRCPIQTKRKKSDQKKKKQDLPESGRENEREWERERSMNPPMCQQVSEKLSQLSSACVKQRPCKIRVVIAPHTYKLLCREQDFSLIHTHTPVHMHLKAGNERYVWERQERCGIRANQRFTHTQHANYAQKDKINGRRGGARERTNDSVIFEKVTRKRKPAGLFE